jgi:hypothetical protein
MANRYDRCSKIEIRSRKNISRSLESLIVELKIRY